MMKRILVVKKILENSTDEEVLTQVLDYISQARANCDPQTAEHVFASQAEDLLIAYLKKKYPDEGISIVF